MKNGFIFALSLLLLFSCCLCGCAYTDNSKHAVTESVPVNTTTYMPPDNGVITAATTVQTTESTTTSSTTNARTFTAQTNVNGRFTIVGSVAEMVEWMQSDDSAMCTFKQMFRQTKTERLLCVQSDNAAFVLERIEIYHDNFNMDFHFINENNEEIVWRVDLLGGNTAETTLEARVETINQTLRKKFHTVTPPLLSAGDDVVILGKLRQTYISNFGRGAYGCIAEQLPALFLTDIDGFFVEGSSLRKDWDKQMLDCFQFSYMEL